MDAVSVSPSFDLKRVFSKSIKERAVITAILQLGKNEGGRPYFSPGVVWSGIMIKIVRRPIPNKMADTMMSDFFMGYSFQGGKGGAPFPVFPWKITFLFFESFF